MKHQTFTFIVIFTILFNSNLFAKWESLGDDIIPQNHRVWSIKVAPDKSVWAISTFDNFPPTGYYPRVHRSNDGGATWTETELPVGLSTYGWDISPIDSNTAFIALNTAGLYRTTDGGMNWEEVTSFPFRVLFVHFFNNQEGLAFGTDGSARTISLTNDAGDSWTHLGGQDWLQPEGTSLPTFDGGESVGLTFSVNSFYDYQGDTFILGNSNGTYWISYDKGYNWERKPTPLVAEGLLVSNVAMKDENTFMVVGDTEDNTFNGVTAINFTTQDGGETWIEGNSGLTAAASHYLPNSDSIFIMVGHNDFGWGSEGTAISYDYGENWERLDNTGLIAIDFIDENTGYGSCCNNVWATANGQIHKWNFDLATATFEIIQSDRVQLMPNPVQEQLTIVINQVFQANQLSLEIIAANGQVVFMDQVSNDEHVSVSVAELPAGFYTVRVAGSQSSVVKKFIKQ